jgi:hypothetical protein
MFDGITLHQRLARLVNFKNGVEEQVKACNDGVPLGLATDLSHYSLVYHANVPTPPFDHTIISYHLYRHREPLSVFNELQEEVGKTLRLATEEPIE